MSGFVCSGNVFVKNQRRPCAPLGRGLQRGKRSLNISSRPAAVKQQLLEAIASLDEGRAIIDDKDAQERVEDQIRELEALNQFPQTISSELLDGSWNLKYTTSKVILGKNLPGVFQYVRGSNRQILNTKDLTGVNKVKTKFAGLFEFEYVIQLSLTARPPQRALVKFENVKLGPFTFNLSFGVGYIDVTYIDDDLRITRGSEGNVFILVRE
ncbi:hypothetical protein NDN08_000621 [Rhodosorus marinus]|uniref:Plastid lipid-associated protein/fibrillin conserved domain-containing protein n=1 Tax=Rhodosorus marinus TaxID=101924 RepID=A0AAV8USJ2_9RHOD|nr:hypothetical protein NDN08_000621 [Rhodosorus marinus]